MNLTRILPLALSLALLAGCSGGGQARPLRRGAHPAL